MVFPSAQDYLDPPNWNQQIQQQGGGGGSGVEVQPRHEGGIQGMVRPASMADRARLAKLPQPEQALKCPRCDSTNTKFCYFNNYSLSQPRHFCKTCRRYWTRGGALRNIPVGGGCRRNKRSKSGGGSSSKSQASTSTTPSSSSGAIMPIIPSGPPQLQFMGSLQAMGDYAGGLNFPGIQSIDGVDYHVGGSGGSSVEMEPWRFQQFPFMGGLEAAAPAPVQAMYSFDGEGGGAGDGGMYSGQMHSKAASAGLITQLASVKMEDSPHALNLRRQYLGFPARNDQYWSGAGNVGGGSSTGGWMTDLSGFNSSGHGNLL